GGMAYSTSPTRTTGRSRSWTRRRGRRSRGSGQTRVKSVGSLGPAGPAHGSVPAGAPGSCGNRAGSPPWRDGCTSRIRIITGSWWPGRVPIRSRNWRSEGCNGVSATPVEAGRDGRGRAQAGLHCVRREVRSIDERGGGPMSTKSLPWGLVVGFALFQGLSVEMWAQGAPTLRVAHDQSKREIILELGPFDFPANAPHEAVRQPDAQTVQLPVGGWIHGFRVELVDVHGRPVSQQVLHHVNVISPDERELFSQIMLRVAAAGQETGPVVLPRMVGYRIREGQRVLVTAAFHNPTPSTYRDVVLRVRLPYTPADAWLRPVTGFPLYMDVMPPASVHAYDLPPGRSVKSWEGSPAVPGRILGLGGHLHKYGVVLRLEDVTEGKILWEAEPILDAEGEVIGMPMKKFLWTLGIPIRPDHVYRLTAIYENPTGETIPDGA